MTLRLVRLDCSSCGSALRGEPYDILYLCEHCGSGWVLEVDGMRPITSTAFLPAAGRKADVWLLGWLIEVDVAVKQRFRADGSRSPDTSAQRSFVIPGFALPLRDLTTLSRALSGSAGSTSKVPRATVRGGTLTLADALTFIRHLVVAEEAHKPDMLASVQVEAIERRSGLVALPFQLTGDKLACAVTGTTLKAV